MFQSKVKPIDILLREVAFVHWSEVGKGLTDGPYVVKLGLRGASFVKLQGFTQAAFKPLADWLDAAGKKLSVEKVSTRGANYGLVKVDNHRVQFVDRDDLTVFDVPISTIQQTVVTKNEVAIEFPADEDHKSLASQMETLCEIRIFVPNDEREKVHTTHTRKHTACSWHTAPCTLRTARECF